MKLIFLAVATFFCANAFATSPFKNIKETQTNLGFDKYYPLHNKGRTLRIAVLDKGFKGYEKEIGKTLPDDTLYIAGPVADPEDLKVEHGLKMAQILTALMTDEMTTKQWQPELTLYNVFGFTNFQAAVDDLIANKVDLVLYSEVWEYGGNFDGKGFINAQVTRATKAGVVWVNAAGNFGKTTFNSGIETLETDWVQLPDQNDALSLKCEPVGKQEKCQVKVVLSWNDFKNDVNPGTKKDLDLALTDDLLNIIQVSSLKQSNDANEARPQYSKYPREIVTADLKKGSYFLRVKNISKNFTRKDKLRLTVDGEGIEMPSHTTDETLLNPADNDSVITVGASDSDRTSASLALGKPDIYAPSKMTLTTGDEFRGSSNSAAIVAAGIGILKSKNPKLKKDELLKKISSARGASNNGNGGSVGGDSSNQNAFGLPLQLLGFGPTGAGCFIPSHQQQFPQFILNVLNQGGVIVQTTAAMRIMTPYDPIQLMNGHQRVAINDMVVVTPRGFELYPRGAFAPPDSIEIFQRPQEAGLCQQNGNNQGPDTRVAVNNFYLP